MNHGVRGRNAHLGGTGLLLVRKFGFRDVVAMKEDGKPRFSLTMWIVLIIAVLFFWGLTYPRVIRSQKKSEITDAINNARRIGFALFEFETEFGSFPDQTTAARVPQKKGVEWMLGDSSANDYFRQLIAGGFTDDETLFYAKTAFSRKPDNRIKPGVKALAPGEVGFGYLMNGKSAFSTKGNPSRPIACAPLAFDGKTVSDQNFDLSLHAYAVVLRIDNSVTSLPIVKTSKLAALGGGKTLLDTGPDTVWGSAATPVIVPPLPKR